MKLATLVALAILLVASTPTAAEPEAKDRPWAIGVSAEEQGRATALFEQGNGLLDQGLFVQALDIYRQAIARWDHPAIRYNLGVALINLDRQIDAYRELESALRFGVAGLEADVYPQAVSYQRLLRAQIVRFGIDCVDADTKITLDGKDLDAPCPGASQHLMLPGRHRVIAAKPGFVTRTIDLVPSGGETPRERIDLMTVDEATVTRRRWKRWKPWAVVGTGVGIGLVGLGFELQAAATFRSYDRAIQTLCPDGPCESVPPVVSDAYEQGRRETRIAAGLFVTAGATVATGAVLLWLNRAISERIGYDRMPAVSVNLGTGTTRIGAAWTF